MRLSIYCTYECTVCQQPLVGEDAFDRRIAVLFLGSVSYSACAKCGQAVPTITKKYVKRTDKYIKRLRAEYPRRGRVFAHVG